MQDHKRQALKELATVPHIGKKSAEALWNIGVKSLSDLKNRDPEELYLMMQGQPNIAVDRIMLYVLRCAVYYASNKETTLSCSNGGVGRTLKSHDTDIPARLQAVH